MRRVFALLIVVFLGLPTLFAAIWAVGLTRAALSPELLADLPHRVVSQLPELADDLVAAAEDGRTQVDPDSRTWLRAIARSPMKLDEALHRSGLSAWAEGELSDSLTRFGQVLRGRADPDEATLDLRPLKVALQSEALVTFSAGVTSSLPPCDAGGQVRWQNVMETGCGEIPPCRPPEGTVAMTWKNTVARALRDMPDRVRYFHDDHPFPPGVNWAKAAVTISALVFLLPLLLLAAGAGVAGGGWGKFLHWLGLSAVAGGLLAWGSVEIGRRAMVVGVAEGWHRGADSLFPALHWFLFQPGTGILATVGQIFFDPVATVAQTTCVVGLILFAFGFFLQPKPKAPAAPPPATPA